MLRPSSSLWGSVFQSPCFCMTALTAIWVSTQQPSTERDFLTLPTHLSFGFDGNEMQRRLFLLLHYPSLCIPSQVLQSPTAQCMSLASQPLFKPFLISCTLPRCYQLASRQPRVLSYMFHYQIARIKLLHKDLKRQLLDVSEVLYILTFPFILWEQPQVQIPAVQEALLPS